MVMGCFKADSNGNIKLKGVIRVENKVTDCTFRIEQARENNFSVNNYLLHLMKRYESSSTSLFLLHLQVYLPVPESL